MAKPCAPAGSVRADHHARTGRSSVNSDANTHLRGLAIPFSPAFPPRGSTRRRRPSRCLAGPAAERKPAPPIGLWNAVRMRSTSCSRARGAGDVPPAPGLPLDASSGIRPSRGSNRYGRCRSARFWCPPVGGESEPMCPGPASGWTGVAGSLDGQDRGRSGARSSVNDVCLPLDCRDACSEVPGRRKTPENLAAYAAGGTERSSVPFGGLLPRERKNVFVSERFS